MVCLLVCLFPDCSGLKNHSNSQNPAIVVSDHVQLTNRPSPSRLECPVKANKNSDIPMSDISSLQDTPATCSPFLEDKPPTVDVFKSFRVPLLVNCPWQPNISSVLLLPSREIVGLCGATSHRLSTPYQQNTAVKYETAYWKESKQNILNACHNAISCNVININQVSKYNINPGTKSASRCSKIYIPLTH